MGRTFVLFGTNPTHASVGFMKANGNVFQVTCISNEGISFFMDRTKHSWHRVTLNLKVSEMFQLLETDYYLQKMKAVHLKHTVTTTPRVSLVFFKTWVFYSSWIELDG